MSGPSPPDRSGAGRPKGSATAPPDHRLCFVLRYEFRMDAGKGANPLGLVPLAPLAPFPRQDNRSPGIRLTGRGRLSALPGVPVMRRLRLVLRSNFDRLRGVLLANRPPGRITGRER